MNSIRVLLVEDNHGDVVLLREAVAAAGLPYHIDVLRNGVEAMDWLRSAGARGGAPPLPELIVLDLKLPRKGGREVLGELTQEPSLRMIPTVVLSSSRFEIEQAGSQPAACRILMLKPGTFKGYVDLVCAIEAFRLSAQKREETGVRP